MSTINVGTLLTHLAADASGMKRGVSEATQELKRVQSAAEETRNVLKKAIAFEPLNQGLGRLASAVGQLDGAFAKFASTATSAIGAVAQGFFSGGPLGAALAAGSIAISEGIRLWGEWGKASTAATEAAAAKLQAQRDVIASINAEIAKAQRTIDIVAFSRERGISVEHAGPALEIQQTTERLLSLRAQIEAKPLGLERTNLARQLAPEIEELELRLKQLATAAQASQELANRRAEERAEEERRAAEKARALSDSVGKATKSLEDMTVVINGFRVDKREWEQVTSVDPDLQRVLKARHDLEEIVRRSREEWERSGPLDDGGPRKSLAQLRAETAERNAMQPAVVIDEPMRAMAGLTDTTEFFDDALAYTAGRIETFGDRLSLLAPAIGQAAKSIGEAITAIAREPLAIEGLSATGADPLGMLISAVVSLVSQTPTGSKVLEIVNDTLVNVLSAILMVIEPLLPALELLGKAISVIAAIIGALHRAVIEPLGSALFSLFKLVAQGLNALNEAIQSFLRWLASFDIGGWRPFEGLEVAADQLKALEIPIESYGDAQRRLIGVTDDTAKTFERINESAVNLPEGFRRAQYAYEAADPERSRGTSTDSAWPSSSGGGSTGGTTITGNQITVYSGTPNSFARDISRRARKRNLAEGGSTVSGAEWATP